MKTVLFCIISVYFFLFLVSMNSKQTDTFPYLDLFVLARYRASTVKWKESITVEAGRPTYRQANQGILDDKAKCSPPEVFNNLY